MSRGGAGNGYTNVVMPAPAARATFVVPASPAAISVSHRGKRCGKTAAVDDVPLARNDDAMPAFLLNVIPAAVAGVVFAGVAAAVLLIGTRQRRSSA